MDQKKIINGFSVIIGCIRSLSQLGKCMGVCLERQVTLLLFLPTHINISGVLQARYNCLFKLYHSTVDFTNLISQKVLTLWLMFCVNSASDSNSSCKVYINALVLAFLQ